MRLIKLLVLFAVFVMIGSYQTFAQNSGEKDELVFWTVKCVDAVKKGGVEVPCENFSAEGASFSITRDLLINTDMKTSHVTLTFIPAKRDDRRELKILEITPARDENDEYQDYWFSGGKQGPGGGDGRYFITLRMRAHNAKNINNGNYGYVSPGTYTGVMKFKDTVSDAAFTLTLNVVVRKLESKK